MFSSSSSQAFRGSVSVFFSASLWGLFWIPMRYFDENGLSAMWGIAGINIAALIVAAAAMVYVNDYRREDLKWLLIIGCGMGFANVFYFAGLILSDVIRVTFLFYLLPIWATLFARIIFGVKLGLARILAVLLAFIGIWLLLGAGDWPVPQNLGDMFGILSGMAWAFGLTMIRGQSELGAFATTTFGHGFAVIAALGMGIALSQTMPDVQSTFSPNKVSAQLLILVMLFGALVLWTTMLGQVWGAKFIAATTAALLTMSEIVVATGSATMIGNETLPLISWAGAGLIIAAIFVDLFGSKNG